MELKPVIAHVNNFDEFSTRILDFYIKLARENNQKTLPVVIDSYGGEAYSVLGMYDTLKECDMSLLTVSRSKSMSCGSILFSIGQKRFISENSTVMIHKVLGGAFGNVDEIKSNVDEKIRLNEKVFSILDKNCGRAPGYFQNLVNQNKNTDLFLDARAAVFHGLATDIGFPAYKDLYDVVFFQENEIPHDVQNRKLLLSYEEQDKSIFYFNQPKGEESPVDLNTLKASLSGEQLKPINALEIEATNLKSQIIVKEQEKETALNQVKTEMGVALKKSEEKFDNFLIDTLISAKKLTKAEADKKKAILAECSGKGKELIIEDLISLKDSNKTVVPDEIPDQGDRHIDLSESEETNPKNNLDGLVKFAKDNNLNLAKTDEYQQAFAGFSREQEAEKKKAKAKAKSS